MKNLILDRLEFLQDGKKELNRFPPTNELELKNDIANTVNKELDSLIAEGRIKVIGETINRHRILELQT